LGKYTKFPKNYQMTTKIPNWPLYIPNGHQYTNIFHSKALQNWDFWYENIPSGNPIPDELENVA
jgi:hypothetical protein